MSRLPIAISTLLVWTAFAMHGAESGGCKLDVKAEDNGALSSNGKPRGLAVLFGDPVTVPIFRLRFVDIKTGQVLKPTRVTIAYGWKWLEYPYPEHLWGALSEASDVVSCTDITGDEIEVPAFEVKPRGWYDGKFAKFPFSRGPSFTGLGITATLPQCTPRVTIPPKAARDLQGKVAIIKVACRSESTVSYQK
jgi:hypothetical protein